MELADCSIQVRSEACTYGPQPKKTCLWGFGNNTGADKSVHPPSLISTFVLESIINKLASEEISIFKLVSVVEETGLKLTLSETPKIGFVATRPICPMNISVSKWCFNKLTHRSF